MAKLTYSCIFYDGSFDGAAKCSHGTNSLVGYKMPFGRQKDKIFANNDTLKLGGVYLLIQRDENKVYVGQGRDRTNGNGVLGRVTEPHTNCPVWTEALMFVVDSKNNSFESSDVRYLENKLLELVKTAGRYTALNGNTPSHGKISEEHQINLDAYLEDIKLIARILGFDVFVPDRKPIDNDQNGNTGEPPKPPKTKDQKDRFKFSQCKKKQGGFIKPGDFIEWRDNPNLKFEVASDNTVFDEGKEWSLSALAKKISGKKYALNGVLYFKYNGEFLNALRAKNGN